MCQSASSAPVSRGRQTFVLESDAEKLAGDSNGSDRNDNRNCRKRNCFRWQWGTRRFPWIGFAVFAKLAERLCWFLSRKHLLKNICFLTAISYFLKVLSTE